MSSAHKSDLPAAPTTPQNTAPPSPPTGTAHAAGELTRVAVINRGEAARRFIRAVRDVNLEHGSRIETVALVTAVDRDWPYAHEADRVVHLEIPKDAGASAAYLNHDAIVAAARDAGADSAWVGWGFLSEDSRFAQRLLDAGLIFMGPPPSAMQLAGDKIEAKRLAERCGVPVVPWSRAPVESPTAAAEAAERVGYPLVLKAAAGGGGRGIRMVERSADLRHVFATATAEAERAFGDGRMFIEHRVTRARHMEVQIAVDTHGHAVAFGVRDCTVQRRHQKIVEEAPGPLTHPELAEVLQDYALRLAKACGYIGVGTVEFIYDLDKQAPFFMEINARLQVEHPITEQVYGVDLVKLQIDIARGASIAGMQPTPRGYAIELRLNAEDPDNDFAPAPGKVQRFRTPQGVGVRIDSGIVEGCAIPPDFDSMIAKIIGFGATRREALARLRRALGEMAVVVQGGATNKSLLTMILQHPDFNAGEFDTHWLDRQRDAGAWEARPNRAEALLAAAVLGYREENAGELERLYAAAARGIPQNLPAAMGHTLQLGVAGQQLAVDVYCIGFRTYRVYPNAGPGILVHFLDEGPHVARLIVGERHFNLLYEISDAAFAIELDGLAHRISRDAGGVVRASAPAVVTDICVSAGDVVSAGDRLGALEAMKMEMAVRAPQDGRVREVCVQRSIQVATGQPLFVLEPLEPAAAAEAASLAPTHFAAADADPLAALYDAKDTLATDILLRAPTEQAQQLSQALGDELHALFLGYDLDPQRLRRCLNALDAQHVWDRLDDPQPYVRLADALFAYVDVQRLFSRELLRPEAEPRAISMHVAFHDFLRRVDTPQEAAHPDFLRALERAAAHYGVDATQPGPKLRHVAMRLAVAEAREPERLRYYHQAASSVLRVLMQLHRAGADFSGVTGLQELLERLPLVAHRKFPYVADNAYQARYVLFQQHRYERREKERADAVRELVARAANPAVSVSERDACIQRLVRTPESVRPWLLETFRHGNAAERAVAAQAFFRRLYQDDDTSARRFEFASQGGFLVAETTLGDGRHLVCAVVNESQLEAATAALAQSIGESQAVCCDLWVDAHAATAAGNLIERVRHAAEYAGLAAASRVCIAISDGNGGVAAQRTLQPGANGRLEDVEALRGLHPETGKRLALWKLQAFTLHRLESHENLFVFLGRAKENPKDERLFVIGEVKDVPEGEVLGPDSSSLMAFEHAFFEAVLELRQIQARRELRQRLHWNRIVLHVRPVVRASRALLVRVARTLWGHTDDLGLEKIVVHCQLVDPRQAEAQPQPTEIEVANPSGHKIEVRLLPPSEAPVQPASPYELKVMKARALGLPYPYEVIRMVTAAPDVITASDTHFPRGDFQEYDLDPNSVAPRATRVHRPPGENQAAVVFGIISHQTEKHPEGMQRVALLADPLMNMGAVAEPECARIIAALDLAAARGVPVEWLPVCSGARIAMNSGTENLDWTARVLRRIVEFTQSGGEINIIVDGINVGAQSYFNAEATMLAHTRGVLIMTPRGAMVLTGKKALDYSGSVSAEDELGIGGYERIMGRNGQAQYFAADLAQAYQILLQHYALTYIAPGEQHVRAALGSDAPDRDITTTPYPENSDESFSTIGELFSEAHNPGRKKPFSMRALMRAVIDVGESPLERWAQMRDAETSIVWDCHLGRRAVCLIGIESRMVSRASYVPGDGPEGWSGGTLFPLSSKKVTRALNAASGNRPVVVLANLSGFDGSPESMRKLQLEYGAEIGRAVVNFRGPIVFCVVARYHGGAYVVFSKALNEQLHALALEGSYASVIGGAPAAAVVFVRELRKRTAADPRVQQARAALEKCAADELPRLREEHARIEAEVSAEHQSELARSFDAIHTVQRACEVGSLDEVVAPEQMRKRIIEILDAATGYSL